MDRNAAGFGVLILIILGCFVFACGCDGRPYTEIGWNAYGAYTTAGGPYIYGTLTFHEDNTYEWDIYPSGLDPVTGTTKGATIPIRGEYEPADSNHMIVSLPDLPAGYTWHFSDPRHAEFAYDSYYPRVVMYPSNNREEYLYDSIETFRKYNRPEPPDFTSPFPVVTEITPEPYH